jgi:D-alanine-D-alanine ligase-like ATP-grasp enzyme
MAAQSLASTRALALTQDRQRISTAALYLLLAAALLPLALLNTRLLAQVSNDPSGVLAIGEWLNNELQLSWVGADDRDVVLYILLLPMAAFLTAFTRLTLGIRVLGFRAILMSIGLQEIGVIPCLLLILLIAVTVVLVRPLMRRSGLPLFARIAVILCIVAITMVLGLLGGVWLDSPMLWSMAFFPVVILAMLAESIAKTVASESLAVALWRTGATIGLALLIAGISQITAVQELLLHSPELLVTILVLTVLVAEFLDLRLLEDFRPGVARGASVASKRGRVVLLRSRFPDVPIVRSGYRASGRYRRASLQPLIDELRERDFAVSVLEVDSQLATQLSALAKESLHPRHPGVVVLNCAGGAQGAGSLAQAPTICEMLGVAYCGPGPQAPALLDDRLQQMQYLRAAGLAVPTVLNSVEALASLAGSARPTLWLRGRFAADRSPSPVSDKRQFQLTYRRLQRQFGEVLVEMRPPGRAITAVLLHPQRSRSAVDAAVEACRAATPSPQLLALLERGGNKRRGFQVAAGLTPLERERLESAALLSAAALGCRDYARVELYCADNGRVTVGRVVAIDPLVSRSAAAEACSSAGMSLAGLAEALLAEAAARHAGPETLTPGAVADTAAGHPVKLQRSRGVLQHA